MPLINARGFGIKVYSYEDYNQLIKEREGTEEKELSRDVSFSNKWFSLDKYKNIKFNEDSVYQIEYHI